MSANDVVIHAAEMNTATVIDAEMMEEQKTLEMETVAAAVSGGCVLMGGAPPFALFDSMFPRGLCRRYFRLLASVIFLIESFNLVLILMTYSETNNE